MIEPFTQRNKIVEAITEAAGAAGAAEIDGAVVDMSGFEALAIVVTFGAIVTNAVTSIKAQRDTVSTFDDDPQDIKGTSQTVADSDDGKTFVIDLVRPGERYVRLVVLRATQNATVRSAFYVLYDPHEKPTSQGATIKTPEIHVDEPEGTA